MKKLFATGEKGLVQELEMRAIKQPFTINLNTNKKLFEHSAFRVRASIKEFEYGLIVKEEKLQAFLGKIKSKRIRTKVEKASRNTQEREASGRLKGYKTQMLNGAIQAMILDGYWCEKLAGLHGMNREDVDKYYSIKMHLWILLNTEVEVGFLEHLKDKAIEVYRVENKKVEFYKSGLEQLDLKVGLRKLLAVGKFKRNNALPRLMIEQMLYGTNETELLRNKLESYTTLTNKDGVREWLFNSESITQHQYKKSRKLAKEKLNLRQKRNTKLHKQLFLDNESNINMTFIKAFGLKSLKEAFKVGIHAYKIDWEWFREVDKNIEDYTEELTCKYEQNNLTDLEKTIFKPTNPILENTKIIITSVGQGNALIKEYTRWYNTEYKDEIGEDKEREVKIKTNERNQQRRAEGKLVKKVRDENIINLVRSGENNKSKIAKELGVNDRTVRDVVSRYEAVEELFSKGVTIPEAISDQTEIKLTTVIHFIEIITQEQVNTSVLTLEQESLVKAQREEEERTKDVLREKHIRRIEREKINAWKEKMANEVVKLHEVGFNPTGINKLISLSTTDIVAVLKNRGMVPLFDTNLASEEEIKEKEAEQAKQFQIDNKNRPLIKL